MNGHFLRHPEFVKFQQPLALHTLRLTGAVPAVAPGAEAVTLTAYVLLRTPTTPPPGVPQHPTQLTANKTNTPSSIQSAFRSRRIFILRVLPGSTSNPGSSMAMIAQDVSIGFRIWASAVVVLIVMVTLAGRLAPLTEDGENVQLASDGRPEQAKVTDDVNVPVVLTVSFTVPSCPPTTLSEVGLAVRSSCGVVVAALTTCARAALVLPRLLLSPEYVATIEYVPTAENVVVQAAWLEATETAPQPLIVAPLEVKPTVPVGVPGLMVAVNATDWSTVEGFKLEANTVAVVT